MYVYLFGSAAGYFKIGRSQEPGRRRESLEGGSPFPLFELHRILTCEQGISPTRRPLERYLHEAFAHCWVKREWFRLPSEEARLFRQIPSEVLDFIDLPVRVQRLWYMNRLKREQTKWIVRALQLVSRGMLGAAQLMCPGLYPEISSRPTTGYYRPRCGYGGAVEDLSLQRMVRLPNGFFKYAPPLT